MLTPERERKLAALLAAAAWGAETSEITSDYALKFFGLRPELRHIVGTRYTQLCDRIAALARTAVVTVDIPHSVVADPPPASTAWTAPGGTEYDLTKSYADRHGDGWSFAGEWWNIPDPQISVPLMRMGSNAPRLTLPWIAENLGPLTVIAEEASDSE